jgi:hypothetical protein
VHAFVCTFMPRYLFIFIIIFLFNFLSFNFFLLIFFLDMIYHFDFPFFYLADNDGLLGCKIFRIMMSLLSSQSLLRSNELEEYVAVLLQIFTSKLEDHLLLLIFLFILLLSITVIF